MGHISSSLIQVFSVPLLHVHKVKHLDLFLVIQPAFKSICERMGHLSEAQWIQVYYCNGMPPLQKSVKFLPSSTVHDETVCLFVFQRTTVTHPQSVRQRNCWMWTRTLHKSKKLSADSIIAELQSSSNINISTKTVYRELNGIGFHGWAAPVAIMWRFAHIAYIL